MATAASKSKRPSAAKTPVPLSVSKETPARKKAANAVRSRAKSELVVVGGKTYRLEGRSVFQDLGYSEEESRPWIQSALEEVLQQRNSVKESLVDIARTEILSLGLNTSQAADHLSMTRPRVSNILNRKFDKVSIDAIVDVVHKLGKDLRFEVVDRATAHAEPSAVRASEDR